ncbi:hypothetical protein AB0C68_30055 [Streptomyces tendae]|uniref:hypothetical protein n=1 Tax=Streptomyces tendae TaxID=1932 RepID=UPI0033CB5D8D
MNSTAGVPVVPGIVMGVLLRHARQYRLEPLQGLNLQSLVRRAHHRPSGGSKRKSATS